MAARRTRRRVLGEAAQLLEELRGLASEAAAEAARRSRLQQEAEAKVSRALMRLARASKDLSNAKKRLQTAKKHRKGIRKAQAEVRDAEAAKERLKASVDRSKRAAGRAAEKTAEAKKASRREKARARRMEQTIAETVLLERERQKEAKRRQRQLDRKKRKGPPAPPPERAYGDAQTRVVSELVERWMRRWFESAAALFGGAAQIYRYPAGGEVDGLLTLSARGLAWEEVEALLDEVSDHLQGMREEAVFYAETYFQAWIGFLKSAEWGSPEDVSRQLPGGGEEGLFGTNWFLGRHDLPLFSLVITETGRGVGENVSDANDEPELLSVELLAHWNPTGERPDRGYRRDT